MHLRELKSLLQQRGYTSRPGKGSHSIWTHPERPWHRLVLCGRNHDDVPPYQLARAGLRKPVPEKGRFRLL